MDAEESMTPSVTYAYHTYNNPTSASGGPMFILLYLQCIMFLINEYFKLSLEMWQLMFPLFIVIVTMAIGTLNTLQSK